MFRYYALFLLSHHSISSEERNLSVTYLLLNDASILLSRYSPLELDYRYRRLKPQNIGHQSRIRIA
ncbi:hypothetical protein T4B_9673 [Trichinella pseudospiralis]|nr:hypothetical protein T4B_9673 [Trichinella pseudospiralis]